VQHLEKQLKAIALNERQQESRVVRGVNFAQIQLFGQ
jgi:hypothetical protein